MDLASLFITVSLVNGLPPVLLESLCWVESQHNPQAVAPQDGGSPSLGLCQVKQTTCAELGIEGNLFNPEINAKCAGKYLSKQIAKYKSIKRGVCAYNRGKSTGDGTNRYTRKVFREWTRRTSAGHIKDLR